jgi:hypothetical protein
LPEQVGDEVEMFQDFFPEWPAQASLNAAFDRSKWSVRAFRDVESEPDKEIASMSVKGEIKEGAGYIKEEINEHGKSPESQHKAKEGRDLRNEGRIEDGKAPKTTPPGTGHPEK